MKDPVCKTYKVIIYKEINHKIEDPTVPGCTTKQCIYKI